MTRCAAAWTALEGFDGDVLVVSGDTPLIRGELLRDIVTSHRQGHAVATLLTAHVAPPNAYGRVVRDRTAASTTSSRPATRRPRCSR